MKHVFSRSLAIRHLVCGSCNGCEHELNALAGPDYDITAEGFELVASPRHADVVTVAGPMSDAMRAPARAALDAVPHPRVVIAIGDCAAGVGPWCGVGTAGDGAGAELGAEVVVRGCPPTPDQIKAGLREAAERLNRRLD
ncbi:MAG: hypothetical protein KGN02_10330 [bacterium]|nr:hypothetical protein [bacterium]